MMRTTSGRKISGLPLAVALLAGCGIDQGGMPPAANDPVVAAGDRAVLVSGPITGFGSVLVNGLRLEASAAQVTIDGQPGVESDLRVGQVVRAVALPSADGYRALSIDYADNLVGPIGGGFSETSSGQGWVTVLEQPVLIDAATRFDPPSSGPGDLMSLGTVVAVSGLPIPGGGLHATFVRVRAFDPAPELKITGVIDAVDTAGLSLDVGLLKVDYSQATLLDLAGGVPVAGQIVEVRGVTIADGTLVASELRARDSLPGSLTADAAALTDFEMTLAGSATASRPLDVNFVGYVSSANLPGSIVITDVVVVLSNDTVIVGGNLAELVAGTKVDVQGSVRGPGQILADRIELL